MTATANKHEEGRVHRMCDNQLREIEVALEDGGISDAMLLCEAKLASIIGFMGKHLGFSPAIAQLYLQMMLSRQMAFAKDAKK